MRTCMNMYESHGCLLQSPRYTLETNTGRKAEEFPLEVVFGVVVRLMEEILHQLKSGKYPIFYMVLYIQGGYRRISQPSTVVR